MRLRPLQDRVVIRRAEPEAKSAGGIFIPDAVQEKAVEGEIVAVGPGARGKGCSRQGRLDQTDGGQGRRPRAVRQVVRHRGQARQRRTDDHERSRHHGRARSRRRRTAGRLNKTGQQRDTQHGCQGRQI